jgi:hypothetical protein
MGVLIGRSNQISQAKLRYLNAALIKEHRIRDGVANCGQLHSMRCDQDRG